MNLSIRRFVRKSSTFVGLMAFGASGFPSPAANVAEPPVAVDLGANLSYVRVRSLDESPAALNAALAAKHGCVLDLRHTDSTAASIAALNAALDSYPKGTALYILISPATPAAVLDAVNTPASRGLTVGIATANFSPKIAVKTTSEEDRRAYDAFETGTPLGELISGKIEKERFDEAMLVKEFKSGNTEPPPELSTDPTKTTGTAGEGKPAAAPPKDRVLQRALNVQEALLALRR